MSDPSWSFLIIGSFAAVGAAMAFGTLAALFGYRRTGQFPGGEPGEIPPRSRIVGLWIRIVVGLVLTAIGIVALLRQGLL